MVTAVVVVLVQLAIVAYLITVYNGLIALKNNIDKSWSNIDVQLKQRHDEIPKLISVCEGYMKHEQAMIDQVLKAQSSFQQMQDRISRLESDIADPRELFQVAPGDREDVKIEFRG